MVDKGHEIATDGVTSGQSLSTLGERIMKAFFFSI